MLRAEIGVLSQVAHVGASRERHIARVWRQQAREHQQERRLARAVGADEPNAVVALNTKCGAAEDQVGAK